MNKALLVILCILWMGFIFYNSSNIGEVSEERSHRMLYDIKNKYHQIKKEEKIVANNYSISNEKLEQSNIIDNKYLNKREENLNIILRKNAHAFEYMVLAMIVTGVLFSFNIKGKLALIYIMFVCLFYAVTDEFHQMFVPGRTSLVGDVLIDFVGSLIGMAIYYLFYYKFFKRNKVY